MRLRLTIAAALLRSSALATIALVLVACFVTLPRLTAANPLDEIIQSKEFRKRAARDRKLNRQLVQPGTNFSTVFLEKRGAEHLITWTEPLDLSPYSPGKISGSGGADLEIVKASRFYRGNNGPSLSLTVAIPHPRYRDVAANGFLESLNKILQIADEPVAAVEDREHHGIPTRLHLLKSPTCVITGKLPQGGIVRLDVKPSSSASHCRAMFETLNIDRLISKLLS